jgi:hypothetical protein
MLPRITLPGQCKTIGTVYCMPKKSTTSWLIGRLGRDAGLRARVHS